MVADWLTFGLLLVAFLLLSYIIFVLRSISRTFQEEAGKMSRKLIEEILLDEELMNELLDRIVQVIQNTFASSRGVTARDQKGMDRRIVSGLIDQNPAVSMVLDQIGIRDYLVKKPHLVFYILSQYPQILDWFAPPQGGDLSQNFAKPAPGDKILIPPKQ